MSSSVFSMPKLRHLLKFVPVILFVIILDQLSKTFLISHLKTKFGMVIDVTDWFSIVYAWNYGISFGLFSQHVQYSNYAFLIINCLIVGYLVATLRSSTNHIQSYGIAIIIGGAIGNLIDRLARGAVFDFIHLHYEQYNFPAFNLADAFINIGVALVLISLVRLR